MYVVSGRSAGHPAPKGHTMAANLPTDAELLAALDRGVEAGDFVKITSEDDLRAYFATLSD
jgi:hypothetical protein